MNATAQTPTITVLFAEDNDDDVEIVRRTFVRGPVKASLHVVRDGAEAMRFLSRRQPEVAETASAAAPELDLVLLDLDLPKVGGLDVLRQMKADPELRSLPTVMLTGIAADEPIRQCLELGSTLYLLKPLNLADVANIIASVRKNWSALQRWSERAA